MRDRDQHACVQQSDSSFFRVAHDEAAAFASELGFQRARSFVESGMDDTTVESRCLLACRVVLLQPHHRQTPEREFACNGAADNSSCAYDADVDHRSGKSVKMPSTPSVRNAAISAASLIVQT